MIKNFIDKLLGKTGPAGRLGGRLGLRRSETPPAAGKPAVGRRIEVPRDQHGIDPKLIDDRAVKVVTTLQDAGYEAYIVGGAVRDLLLGHRPKDFDVATNATPEQVKALFRRAFIIGRRFRIVHVVHGRGREHEVIEVSTFRAYLDNAAAEQVEGNEKTSKSELAGKSHVVDASGRVLRDNVWGPQDEDAARRDFTVNALYYDPRREIVVDYHHGIADAKKRLLRMIGDPETRYREDPVRIIRVVRFAAKLGFEIEPATRAPILRMADLLANVPASRLFDEMIKLLQTGHALASLEELRRQGLHRGVFPILDAVLDDAHRHDGREKFIQLALADTDRRVNDGRPVAPSFMLACMLWHDVVKRRDKLRAQGEPPMPALMQAIDQVFDARIGDISGRGKLAADMREIWTMQPRFERRTPSTAEALAAQPRFRAGFDFLSLRAEAGEADPALVEWWSRYAEAGGAERHDLIEEARQDEQARRQSGGLEAAAP
ncbi:MAG TPA: polynucleotide adenylyltransferase PcnB, partial [Burkholderiaceae bacterium]|nr:polynucleotide adenylyltransferase PcnB [Burkholderiaceae bacterium]